MIYKMYTHIYKYSWGYVGLYQFKWKFIKLIILMSFAFLSC